MEKSVLEYVKRCCEKELDKKSITENYRQRLTEMLAIANLMLVMDFN